MTTTKFTAPSDLTLFKALQKFGRISQTKLAKKTGLPKTTTQYAWERLAARPFYYLKAIPKLDQFPELPLALVSFADLHPIKLRKLKQAYPRKSEVRVFITNGNEVFMLLMHTSKDRLAELIYEIMKKAQAKPSLHILSPTIHKLDLTIPDKILDAVYPVQKKKK